ncbi:MAG: hypothetical protein IPG80_06315 [Anaerolineales bacterium]|uniref:hypothetical protein n=1 Tax=Candidatus Villigracilis vicinus TaxID=3140679 RepID=UPI0031360370|nr:hypothetical protein [Anaerolineales bacterium]
MKRILPLILALFLTTACAITSTIEAAPLPATEADQPSPTSVPAETSPAAAQPAETNTTLLYISGTTHIESKPQVWPDVDAFLVFLQQVTALGMKWSIGADIGWLEGEPRAAELIQASEALGVQWDVHTHSPQDRAKAAYLITQMGGHPNSVVSGMLVSEFSNIGPQTYQGFTWTPQVLWGGTNCPGHRPGCDDLAAGLWIPLSAEQYTTHNPNGQYVRVGGGTHQLKDGRMLAQSIANGQYTYPVISFTLMVAPTTLQIVESDDGIAEITAFVSEMNGYTFVRWANIEETAQAWRAAGSVPSRIEME